MLSVNTISEEIIEHYLSNSKKLEFPKSLLPNLEKISTEYFKLKKSFESVLDNDSIFIFKKEKSDLVRSIGFNENVIFASVWGANHVVINSSLNNSESKAYPSVFDFAIRASFSIPLSYSENIDMTFDIPNGNIETELENKKNKQKNKSALECDSINIKEETKKLISFVEKDFQTLYEDNLTQAHNKIRKIYYLGEVLLHLLKENIDIEIFLKYNHSYLYSDMDEKLEVINEFLSLNKDIDISDQVNKYKNIKIKKTQNSQLKR